jgi:hypothetical protein
LATNQVRAAGIFVDSVAHCFGGTQCIVIPQDDFTDNVILPCNYAAAHVYLEIEPPTDSDLASLPIYDLTSDEPYDWSRDAIHRFDLSQVQGGSRELFNQALETKIRRAMLSNDTTYTPDQLA